MTQLLQHKAPDRPLRELTDAEFKDLYGCDRFTATVLGSRYRYIVKHMSSALLTHAFSPILRDWYDFATTIAGPPEQDYPMAAVSDSLVLFIGTMAEAVRNAVEEYGPDKLKPGDVLMCNDPYRTGTHVNDICFIRPVFRDGKIISFVNLQAHQMDMGGVVPAGFSGTKKNTYENGVVIPPVLLYEHDQPIKSSWSFILDNARMGPVLMPDIQTIYQSLRLAERLLLETDGRYGREAYLGAFEYCTDASAETMREALRGVPDGVYYGEDAIDCDGIADDEEFAVRVKITKRGGRAEVDLSGTSRQCRTSINAGFLDAKTAVAVAFKFLIDRQSPFTSGSYRDIDVVVPPGTMVSALPPEGVIFIYWESTMPLVLAIFRAMAKAVGEDAIGGDFGSLNIHNANGVNDDGSPWMTMAQCGGEHGPWGATKDGDADSYNVFYLANNIDPPTEVIETDFPIMVLRKEYVPDSGGAGINRGGAGVMKDTLWRNPTQHFAMPLHTKVPSGFGVEGGKAGKVGACWVFEPEAYDVSQERALVGIEPDVYRKSTPIAGVLDPETNVIDPDKGEYVYFARVPVWNTNPNTVFRYVNNGGGGWGDPLQREPERVKRDVRDGYMTIEGAREQYGVVVVGDPYEDPEGLTVDEAATKARREDLAKRA